MRISGIIHSVSDHTGEVSEGFGSAITGGEGAPGDLLDDTAVDHSVPGISGGAAGDGILSLLAAGEHTAGDLGNGAVVVQSCLAMGDHIHHTAAGAVQNGQGALIDDGVAGHIGQGLAVQVQGEGAVFRNHHILRKVVEQLHAGLTGFQRFGDSGIAAYASLHVVGRHLALGDQCAQLGGCVIVEGDLTPLIRHAVDIGPGVTAGGGDSHIGQGTVGGIVVSVAAVTHHQSRHGDLVAAAPVAIQVLVFSIDVSGVQLDVGVGDLGGPAPD